MQRKPAPGFPANSCSIRMPEASLPAESMCEEPDGDQQRRRQQLINFAHSHWGFNNWSWAVTKQELDFVDYNNGKYSAGVVAFVSVTVKNMDIHREDIGYATTFAQYKGSAIFQARKCAVTNALRETFLSFGGTFATGLMELMESQKTEVAKPPQTEILQENNQNVANKVELDTKNISAKIIRKDSSDNNNSTEPSTAKSPHKSPITAVTKPLAVPIAKAQPMPANKVAAIPKPPFPPANQAPSKPLPVAGAPLHARPNSNELNQGEMSEEEQRAERKRRQRQAQEEFRIKQLTKQSAQHNIDGSDSVDSLIMDIPTQELVEANDLKRKSEENQQANKRLPA